MAIFRKLTILAWVWIGVSMSIAACAPDGYEIHEAFVESKQQEIYLDLLPDGMHVPDHFPAQIQDPLLLTAWVFLYNQSELIEIHAGERTSGREMAEYADEDNVPVQWGSEEICRGNSCSLRTICEDEGCVARYRSKETAIIYLSLRYHEASVDMLPNLAGSLAHELYHHQLPFGPVKTSLYEEYWAYKIGGTISKAAWASFEGYDPQDRASLEMWFTDHSWQGVSDRDIYPFTLSMKASGESAMGVAIP